MYKEIYRLLLESGEDYINQNWEIYNVLLKGLPSSAVDMLDEHGWQLALDDWEKIIMVGSISRTL